MGIRGAPGVVVVEVVEGGPAARAGLRLGDLVTAVDGRSTIEDGGLLGYLAERKPGEVVELEVLRAGEDLTLELSLGEFPLDLLLAQPPAAPPAAPRAPKPPRLPPETAGRPGADLRWLGAEERPFLGLRLQELSPGLADYFGLPEGTRGLLVEHVHEGGPAQAAGLRAGDVLLQLDGRAISSMTQLGELQARRRALEEQLERLRAEQRAVELGLEALAGRP